MHGGHKRIINYGCHIIKLKKLKPWELPIICSNECVRTLPTVLRLLN
jgi:hypothetical protein